MKRSMRIAVYLVVLILLVGVLGLLDFTKENEVTGMQSSTDEGQPCPQNVQRGESICSQNQRWLCSKKGKSERAFGYHDTCEGETHCDDSKRVNNKRRAKCVRDGEPRPLPPPQEKEQACSPEGFKMCRDFVVTSQNLINFVPAAEWKCTKNDKGKLVWKKVEDCGTGIPCVIIKKTSANAVNSKKTDGKMCGKCKPNKPIRCKRNLIVSCNTDGSNFKSMDCNLQSIDNSLCDYTSDYTSIDNTIDTKENTNEENTNEVTPYCNCKSCFGGEFVCNKKTHACECPSSFTQPQCDKAKEKRNVELKRKFPSKNER